MSDIPRSNLSRCDYFMYACISEDVDLAVRAIQLTESGHSPVVAPFRLRQTARERQRITRFGHLLPKHAPTLWMSGKDSWDSSLTLCLTVFSAIQKLTHCSKMGKGRQEEGILQVSRVPTFGRLGHVQAKSRAPRLPYSLSSRVMPNRVTLSHCHPSVGG